MIFKTWLKDLSNVQGVINQLNNLGTGASITQMATAVSGLSKEQAILALSSRKLTEDQMKQVLVEAKLLESTISLTTAQATERLSKSLNSEADAKVLLQKYALITHQKLEKNSTLEVTAAKLQEAVANGTLSATEATAIANAYGLTIANGAQTASWKLLTSAIWQNVKAIGAWLVSNPLGWLTLAVGAIAGLTAGFVYLSQSAERAKDKLEESAEAFSQAKSEVENLNSELQTTKQRIDELSAKENLTLVESEELDKLKETNQELERELRLRESIALEKGKQANEDAIDYFGSQSTYGTTAGNIDISGDQLEILDFQLEKIKELEEYFKTADAENKDFLFVQNEKLLAFLKEETAKTIEEFMELDDSLMEGYDEGYLDRLDKLYQKYDEMTNGVAQSHTNTISGVLEKVDFKDNKEQLIELGKNGSLSVETLTSKFPALIGYLDNAGVSAQELYQYIMALANPDAVKYDELKHQLQDAMGFGSGIHTLWAVDMDKQLQDLGLYDEDALEVFATIKAKYVNGETESWTPEDWIANIQEGLESLSQNPDEITVLGISETVDELNTKLKPAMDSLASAWEDIFSGENGEMQLDKVDLLSVADEIRSALDEMSDPKGLNLDVDYSAYEDFISILKDSESTQSDVEEGFDRLAQSIVNASVSGAEDFDTLKSVLEDLGFVESELTAFEALVSNTESLKEAGLDLKSATPDEFNTFIEQLGISAENTAQAIDILTFAKELCNIQGMDTSGEVANLKTLAENAGYTGDIIKYLTELEQIYQDVASGTLSPGMLDKKLARAEELKGLIEASAANINYEPKFDGNSVTSGASKAGKDAGDAYLEAFEKELSALEDLRDRGIIDESEYLERLRALYTRYFKDREKYLDEYNKYERQYLEGMKSLHDSALSGITKLIGKKIDGYQDAKDTAIESLEAEKEAAEEAYQAQIDAIDEQIEAKQKIIDGINDEIDAMQEANEERNRQIGLQKAQFELQKMMSQRTQLAYQDGQMTYRADESGIRDARENVNDAKLEIEIAQKEKSIDLIEDEIDLLEEQKKALEEMKDASNEYYDKLIKQQEKYYDSLIKNAESQKSKWEELAEIQEVAEAYSAIEQVFGDLGYSVEDVLNGSAGAFEDFKAKYISIISDLNSNSSFTEGLSYATGVAKEDLGSFIDKTREAGDAVGELGNKGSELDAIANSMDNTASSAETLNTNTEGVDENLSGISDSLNTMPESTKVSSLATAFGELAKEIQNVATALGIGADASVSGLVQALTDISELSLDDADKELGIIAQFGNLKAKVDEVTNAISGSGSSSASSKGNNNVASGVAQAGLNANAESGSANSLTGAIEEMAQKAEESLGNGGDSEEGTIGKFNALKTAVQNVIDLIGTEANTSGSAEGAENLISAIQLQYDRATEILPLEKLLFEELLTTIDKCVVSLNKMVSAFATIAELGGMPTLPNGGGGHSRGYAEGTVGKAFANGTGGYNGLPHDEKNALRSEYGQPELTVYPNGDVEYTDTPTMSDLPRNTIIFNEEQTKRIMNNKGTVLGNAYANGTDDLPVLQKTELPSYLRPLQEGDKGYELTQKFLAHQDKLINQIIPPVTAIERNMELLTKNISNVNTNTVNKPSLTINGGINVTCPGVNSKEVMSQVSTALKKELGGIALEACQEANITR